MSLSAQVSGSVDIQPLGDTALLVRFAKTLDIDANLLAIQLANALEDDPVSGALEVLPSLVSVLVRYDPEAINSTRLAGEIQIRLQRKSTLAKAIEHRVEVSFGGDDGPDLAIVAQNLQLTPAEFVEKHNAKTLRVIATGFAPGFVYCGLHGEALELPRRQKVRSHVAPGSVLFAARQTAIAATEVPTGWHLIGRTSFRNFDASTVSPTRMRAGDTVRFVAVP